jgi:hypothetical protein
MGKVIDLQQQRGPGRVRTPARRPSPRRSAKTAVYNQELEEFTESDPVVRAARGESVESLYAARDAVAQEAASLLFERKRAVPGSREAARISTRRIAALVEVGSLTIAINRASPGQPSPERLRRVLGHLRKDVENAIEELFDVGCSTRLLYELARRLPDDAACWFPASPKSIGDAP